MNAATTPSPATTKPVSVDPADSEVSAAALPFLRYRFTSSETTPSMFFKLVHTHLRIRKVKQSFWALYFLVLFIAICFVAMNFFSLIIGVVLLIPTLLIAVSYAYVSMITQDLEEEYGVHFECASEYLDLAPQAKKFLGIDILFPERAWNDQDIHHKLTSLATDAKTAKQHWSKSGLQKAKLDYEKDEAWFVYAYNVAVKIADVEDIEVFREEAAVRV